MCPEQASEHGAAVIARFLEEADVEHEGSSHLRSERLDER